jgi:hypothetical protein
VSQTQTKPKTVKFEALKLLKEAEDLLLQAQNKLIECENLEGDNEAKEFAEILWQSIDKDRKTLCRGRFEAEEMW